MIVIKVTRFVDRSEGGGRYWEGGCDYIREGRVDQVVKRDIGFLVGRVWEVRGYRGQLAGDRESEGRGSSKVDFVGLWGFFFIEVEVLGFWEVF